MSDSLWTHGLEPARFLYPQDFPGKNTGVGCHFLLQGILPTQGSNPYLLHGQAGSLPLSYLESPLGSKRHFIIPSQISNQYRPAVRTENHWNINWFKKKKKDMKPWSHDDVEKWKRSTLLSSTELNICSMKDKVPSTWHWENQIYEHCCLSKLCRSFIQWRWHFKSVWKGCIINKGRLRTCKGAGALSGTKDAMAGKEKKVLKVPALKMKLM